MNLLHIDASPLAAASASRSLTATLTLALRQATPSTILVRRDLAADPLAHWSPQEATTPQSQAVLDEFLAADLLVIGVPMYNFGLPSQLKAWLDRVLVAGRTFRYGPQGPEPLTHGKRAFLVSTRGGVYAPGTPGQNLDFQERHLVAALGFIGVRSEIVRAEGLALGEEARASALQEARATIATLVPSLKQAA